MSNFDKIFSDTFEADGLTEEQIEAAMKELVRQGLATYNPEDDTYELIDTEAE